jgi:diguanylate cyclase (GGDEF)-like protein/PAS domain S-box-containing protein
MSDHDEAPAPQTRPGRWGRLLAWAALAAGMAVSASLWVQSRQMAHDGAQARLAQRLSLMEAGLAERMSGYADLLAGTAGLFAASAWVSREEFARYAAALELERYPGLQHLGYLQRSSSGELDAHEWRVRVEADTGERLAPNGARSQREALVYLEPFTDVSRRVPGYDPGADPLRRDAMERARDSATLAVSARLSLPQMGGERPFGVVLYRAVYRTAVPRATVAQRRAALLGYVSAAVRADELMRSVTGSASDVAMTVYDRGAGGGSATLLHGSAPGAPDDTASSSAGTLQTEFAAGDRQWTLQVQPLAGFAGARESREPRAVLVAGVALSLLLFLSLNLLAAGQRRAALLARRMSDTARARGRRFSELARHAPVGVYVANAQGDYVYVNERWCELAQLSEEQARGRGWLAAVHADDRARVQEAWDEAVQGESQFEQEFRFAGPGGQSVYAVAAARPEHDEQGRRVGHIGTCMDISARRLAEMALTRSNEALEERVRERTGMLERANAQLSREVDERARAEDALRRSNERLQVLVRELEQRTRARAALNELGNLLGICNTLDEGIGALSRSLAPIFPSTSGCLYWFLPGEPAARRVARWGRDPSSTASVRREECWALRRAQPHHAAAGEDLLLCEHLREVPAPGYSCAPLAVHGQLLGLLYCQPDAVESPGVAPELAGEQRAAWRQWVSSVAEYLALALSNLMLRESLETQARHDPLTDLYNRRYMEEALEREVRRSERSRRPMGLIMLDLDHFKRYNDTYGHETGDRLLVALARFLTSQVRAGDIVCRYGGEEFLIILPEATLEQVTQRAEQLRRSVTQLAVEADVGVRDRLTLSLGVAMFPEHGGTAAELVRTADSALYRAKRSGRDRVEVGRDGETDTALHVG